MKSKLNDQNLVSDVTHLAVSCLRYAAAFCRLDETCISKAGQMKVEEIQCELRTLHKSRSSINIPNEKEHGRELITVEAASS